MSPQKLLTLAPSIAWTLQAFDIQKGFWGSY